jgi:serine/threonine-protein kinase RsbW
VLKYASARTVELSLELDDREARLELRDDGQPFDPLGAPAPDLESPMEERGLGGLGIHLVKELADDIQYRREAGFNFLLLRKRLG